MMALAADFEPMSAMAEEGVAPDVVARIGEDVCYTRRQPTPPVARCCAPLKGQPLWSLLAAPLRDYSVLAASLSRGGRRSGSP